MNRYIHYITKALVLLLVAFVTPNVKAVEITTNHRPWLEENEFAVDSSLHATLDQIIIFDLEPVDRPGKQHAWMKQDIDYDHNQGHNDRVKYNSKRENDGDWHQAILGNGKDRYHRKEKVLHGKQKKFYLGHHQLRFNSARFVLPDVADISFCIPEEDPYIAALAIETVDGNKVLWSEPGDECRILNLAAGSYRLHILHDPLRIKGHPKKVFVHRLATPFLFGASNSSLVIPDFTVLRGTNGRYVTDATPGPVVPLELSAATVGPHEVWRIDLDSSAVGFGTLYNLSDGNKTPVKFQDGYGGEGIDVGSLLFTGTTEECCGADITVPFIIRDFGSGQITLTLEYNHSGESLTQPVTLDANNQLQWLYQDSGATVFTWDYKGFDCGTECDGSHLPLQEGEVALFAGCDYAGPAIVFQTDVPDLSIYNSAASQGLAMGDKMVSSVRVGPNTLAFLHTGSQYSGSVLGIGGDTACLDGATPGSETASSLQIKNLSQYILSTNTCVNCILTGADLSNDDLSSGNYSGSTFSGADLTDTSFQGATLSSSDFSGLGTILNQTDFTSAGLNCTDMNSADLTAATFGNNTLVTDHSCFLDLSDAVLDYTTFDTQNWRYFNLAGSTMNNVPDILSTAEAPLDLSGGNISSVQWLNGKTLDYVNLGCYASDPSSTTTCPDPNGVSSCSTLQGTGLTGASLKHACFKNGSMEGAFLDYSNLDGADLSGAQLEGKSGGKAATLIGAFMRNVNMSGANLTGVNASNVNFYSSSSTETAQANDLTAPGANFSEAYLEGADFSGSTSNLQSTIWTEAMLINANFSQADLSTNTSGGVNSGTDTTFKGAYLQGAIFDQANISDVDFTSTYWDATGSGGEFNFLIPQNNLNFNGYWKSISLPECPAPEVKYDPVSPPTTPTGTDQNNTCPSGAGGSCDGFWDQPKDDISTAFFKSESSGFPQVGEVADENQCGGTNNPADFCWTVTDNPGKCPEN